MKFYDGFIQLQKLHSILLRNFCPLFVREEKKKSLAHDVTMQTLVFSTTNPSAWNTHGYTIKNPPKSTAVFRRLPNVSAVASPPALRTLPPEKVQIFKSLESWATQNVLPLLKPVEKSWQPTEFLPNPAQNFDDFTEEVHALRHRTSDLPDEYLVVLVGDMITEEALPTYQSMINRLDGVKDETGACTSPWAIWTRAWTAEENRHGDLLKTYLYLSGRVDMTMIDKTIQYLLSSGMVRFLISLLISSPIWSIQNLLTFFPFLVIN